MSLSVLRKLWCAKRMEPAVPLIGFCLLLECFNQIPALLCALVADCFRCVGKHADGRGISEPGVLAAGGGLVAAGGNPAALSLFCFLMLCTVSS